MVRKGRLSGNDPFAPPSGAVTNVRDSDGILFGSVDKRRMSIRLVSIFYIYPDPTQPRRAVPSVVRSQWDHKPDTVTDMFSNWLQLIEQERGKAFDLDAYLAPHTESESALLPEDQPTYGPLEGAFLPIVQLAGSILREGLVNPITVVGQEEPYQLETGERRWLAYHLLHAYADEQAKEQWEKISVHAVSDFSRFRQIAENTARQDLNAIGRARQYALLLMAMYPDYEPTPYKIDQAFYAQALELNVPYGKRDKLLSALGVTSGSALDRYKQLLRLDTDLWIRGDDENLSERELFRVQNNLDNRDLPKIAKPKPVPIAQKKHKKILNSVWQSVEQNQSIDIRQIEHIRRWLDEVEEQLGVSPNS